LSRKTEMERMISEEDYYEVKELVELRLDYSAKT
jgi:hypothetical protein